MDGRYHGMDYRRKNTGTGQWAAPIAYVPAEKAAPGRAEYRVHQPPATVYVEEPHHAARQRVAVGRNGETQYSVQARPVVRPLYEEPPAPEEGYAEEGPYARAYERLLNAQEPMVPPVNRMENEPPAREPAPAEDDPIAAWEAQRAAEKPQGRQGRADKRELLERKMSRVVLGILSGCFALGAALMLVLPRSTVSMIEKRQLAQLPAFSLASYFSGEFTAGVANFYDDTVPMRDQLKNMGNNLKAVFGLPKSEDSVEFVGTVNKVGGREGAAPPASQPEGQEPPAPDGLVSSTPVDTGPISADVNNGASLLAGAAGRRMDGAQAAGNRFREEEAEANITENGLIVVKQDGHFRGLELFGGGLGESYAAALNDLYGQVGDHVQIWSMPAPLACEFYLPKNYEDYSVSQSDSFDKTHALLNTGIHTLNICDTLSRHVDEPIYCRTDHHWQPLGAYYAAQAFAEAAGVPFNDLSTYTPGKIEGFVGSMYSYTGSADILNDPEDFVYYTPGVEYTSAYYDVAFNFLWDEDDLFAEGAGGSDAYMYYLGGDGYIVKTDTQVENGRRLLIVKDSYGNATVPFFTGSFEQIYVADVRYLERNLVSFINGMGVTDVLFTMSSYSLVGSQGANIANLLAQSAGETVTDGQ